MGHILPASDSIPSTLLHKGNALPLETRLDSPTHQGEAGDPALLGNAGLLGFGQFTTRPHKALLTLFSLPFRGFSEPLLLDRKLSHFVKYFCKIRIAHLLRRNYVFCVLGEVSCKCFSGFYNFCNNVFSMIFIDLAFQMW